MSLTAATGNPDSLWLITEAIRDAVIVIDTAGMVVRWNRAATRIFGFTPEEAAGRPLHELIIPPDRDAVGGEPLLDATREAEAQRKDGTRFPVEITVSPLELDGQRLAVGVLRDISRRKAMERTVQESEARYRGLVDDSIQGIVIHRDFTPLYCNRAYAEMHGYPSPEELLTCTLLDHIIPPERHADARAYYRMLVRGDRLPIQRRVRHHRKDGRVLWVDIIDRRVDWMGEPASQVCVSDVTGEAAAEVEMVHQATLLQETLETMEQGLLRVDRNLDIVAFNRRYLELLALPPERVQLRRPLADVLAYDAVRTLDDPTLIADYIEAKLRPLRDRQPHRYELRLPDDRIIEVRGQPTPDGGGLRTYTDITLRYRLEQAQRELLEAIPLPMMVTKLEDGLFLYANYVAFELLNITPHAEDRPALAADIYINPADRIKLVESLRTNRQVTALETRLRGKDGHEMPVLLSSRLFIYQGEEAVLTALTVIHERKRLERELVAARDRAEKALADLQRTQADLVEAAKLASLGGLVAGVAHELNTPMGVVLTAVSHLGDQADALLGTVRGGKLQKSQLLTFLDTLQQTVSLAQANTERAARLIQSFKQIAADQTSEDRRRFNLDLYLREILTSLAPKIRQQGHDIRLDCPGGLDIDSYPGPLFQVVSNIVMNATLHAFEPDRPGRIHIQADPAPPGGVALTIADNGRGMTADVRARIFEPFFTTRRSTGGTGLGLHMVHNMVTRTLKGRIRCQSEPGAGTRFVLWLPLTPEPAP
ncbi:MAG TPA: PAS domain S-box protein [Azospirillaceae bacterium]|nr:PAS domain S-box protein [Azospirillaceae bacterium]